MPNLAGIIKGIALTPLLSLFLQPTIWCQTYQTKSEMPGKVAPGEIRRLMVGKPVEREMHGGESHTYEVSLETGRFLDAVVDQHGINVIVIIVAPDGKMIKEV